MYKTHKNVSVLLFVCFYYIFLDNYTFKVYDEGDDIGVISIF